MRRELSGNRLRESHVLVYLGVKANVKQRHIKLMMFPHSLFDGKLIREDYDNKIFHRKTNNNSRRRRRCSLFDSSAPAKIPIPRLEIALDKFTKNEHLFCGIPATSRRRLTLFSLSVSRFSVFIRI